MTNVSFIYLKKNSHSIVRTVNSKNIQTNIQKNAKKFFGHVALGTNNMWGHDMPIGTIMKDPKTLKVYTYNGKCWIFGSGRTEKDTSLFEIEIKEFKVTSQINEIDVPIFKNRRGRPRKVDIDTKKRKREPTEYNLYIKERLLEGAYSDFSGNERLRKIAFDWTLLKK